MAQRTQIFLTDDLDGTDIPAGKGETIPFALDGRAYESTSPRRTLARFGGRSHHTSTLAGASRLREV